MVLRSVLMSCRDIEQSLNRNAQGWLKATQHRPTTGSSGLSDAGESSPLSTSTPEYPAPRASPLLRVSSRPTSSKSEVRGDDLRRKAATAELPQQPRGSQFLPQRNRSHGAHLQQRARGGQLHLPDVALLAAREVAPAPGLFMCRGVAQPTALPSGRLMMCLLSRLEGESRPALGMHPSGSSSLCPHGRQ